MASMQGQKPTHRSKIMAKDQIIPLLLQAPADITMQVLGWLEVPDLLALRATNRQLHYLIHNNEETIARDLSAKIFARLDLDFHNWMPYLTIPRVAQLEQRLEISRTIACTLADHTARMLRLSSPELSQSRAEEWRQRKTRLLYNKFLPSFLVLFEYFEKLRKTIRRGTINFASLDDKRYLLLRNIYRPEEQEIMTKLEHASWDVHWTFQLFVFFQDDSRLSRYCVSKYEDLPVKTILAYSGLKAFAHILPGWKTQMERKREFAHFYDEAWLKRWEEPAPLSTKQPAIHNMEIEMPRFSVLPPNRSREVQLKFMNNQNLWASSWVNLALQSPDRYGKMTCLKSWLKKVVVEPGDKRIKWDRPFGSILLHDDSIPPFELNSDSDSD